MEYISKSEKETSAIAQKFAQTLKGGEVIGLIGELGAGKTTFTKAIAKTLEISKHLTSPTFVLMKIYKTSGNQIKNLIHIDAYRLKTAGDLLAIGAEEYLERPDTITIIEWADRIKDILPKKTKLIKITTQGKNRIIKFKNK